MIAATVITAMVGLRVGSIVASEGSTSKGMTSVALVELGSGCCHALNPTKAAVRACNDAVEWNSIKVRTIIPGSYDAMLVHVHIACPRPDLLDLSEVAQCFPYGTLVPMTITEGGMLASSRAGLPEDEPTEAMMTVANACVTVGYGQPVSSVTATRRTSNSTVPPPSQPPPPPTSVSPPPPTLPPPPAPTEAVGRGQPPSTEEMKPGSPQMLARAATARARRSELVLTPLEAFALIGDEDDIEVYDVRTQEQRSKHSINDQGPKTVTGSVCIPLDDLVSGAAPMPPAGAPVVLVCSRGPKSLVALDYLCEACDARVVCVEGGISAWHAAALPTDDL